MIDQGTHGARETGPPPVWKWYGLLCVLLVLMNVGLVILGVWFIKEEAELSRLGNFPPGAMRFYGMLYISFGAIFAVGNALLPFLPRKPWAYVLHATNIVAGGLTCLLLPLAVPVFLYWLKPETRDYFEFR